VRRAAPTLATMSVPPRATNLALLGALILAFATGVGAVWTGSARGAWIVVAHGLVGVTVVLLIPWKGRVVRHAIRRKRWTRWLSYALAALALTALATGLLSATGLATLGDRETLWWHVATALALIPLVLWHVVARLVRPRRTDLSRRNVLRAGTLAGLGVAAYAATATIVAVTGLPGARRRFTGSHAVDPANMPSTIWLDDTTPAIDPDAWRLHAAGRSFSLGELATFEQVTTRATLDCTSGWYAEQGTGVRLRDLVRPGTGGRVHRSVTVHSATGYWVRLPLDDLDSLLLATRSGDRPLRSGHGFPLRLVAPGRRGYWWVKWVDRVELSEAPWWWQPPFPVT
jgi:hypothetical protein